MIFLDTSVLIAVAQINHTHHAPSLGLWSECKSQQTAVSAHALAEVYHVLTAMPPALRLAPGDAVLAAETFLKRLTAVALTSEEYVETLRSTAQLGHTGGMVYDALQVACARKVKARQIYTWNVRHFRLLAPDLAERIITP